VVSKLRMNNTHAPIVDEGEMDRFQPVQAMAGWEMGERAHNCWDSLGSVVMLLLFLSQTFLLVYPELANST
jgi:hypothetical protein